ncbi:hypothetical protein BGW38_005919, partial [Lunasporangiospora selenospora]
MKFTSILSLTVALCVAAVHAAPNPVPVAAAAIPSNAVVINGAPNDKAKKKPTTTTPAKPKKSKTPSKKEKSKSTKKVTKKVTKKATKTTKEASTTTKKASTTTKKPTTTPVKKPSTTTTPVKPTPVVPKVDPCSTLASQGKSSDSILTWEAVRGCYQAQAYDPAHAAKILTSVENLVGNVYVFLDQAKAPSKAPFRTPQVDIMAELKKFRTRKFKSDYEFNMALTYMTFSVNDGHFAYRNDCYKTATFTQPISLYAPVVDGVQNIRVFYADEAQKGVPKGGLTDCVVSTIDGVPALKAVQDFTDRTSAISKDPGVRLNDALASTSWYNEWMVSPGGFSKRWEVPAKATMEYTIQCGAAAPQKLTVPWIVQPSDAFLPHTFKDTKTYWNVQCLAPLSPYDNSRKNNDVDPRRSNDAPGHRTNGLIEAPGTKIFRERGSIRLPSGGRNGRNGAPAIISKAKEVLLTATTAFYQINKSNTCVAVIASEEAAYFKFDPSDYLEFIAGLEKLRDGGCKKLILDMTNNGGGSVDFAYFINLLFFPKAKPYFVEDLRSNNLAQAAAKIAIKQSRVQSVFDARGYVSMATNKVYTDHSMFTKGVNYKRGGTTSTYTQKNYFEYGWSFLPLAANRTLPWAAKDMAIVTNGFCGSACTMIATRFNIEHKVRTYAIGGIQKTPLSYFTFPGGFVMDNDAIFKDVQTLGYKGTNNPTKLPVQGWTRVAVGEIYATEKSTIPLEYDTQYFAANVHLDQDPISARNPDNVWIKIAADF